MVLDPGPCPHPSFVPIPQTGIPAPGLEGAHSPPSIALTLHGDTLGIPPYMSPQWGPSFLLLIAPTHLGLLSSSSPFLPQRLSTRAYILTIPGRHSPRPSSPHMPSLTKALPERPRPRPSVTLPCLLPSEHLAPAQITLFIDCFTLLSVSFH